MSLDLTKIMFYKDTGGRYTPFKRKKETIWIHPDTQVAYYETGEDTEWLRERGFVQKVAWVLVKI